MNLDDFGKFWQALKSLLKGTFPMVIFVENRHDIQGICFFLITISISEKDVPFAWSPPPFPCPLLSLFG